MKRDRLVTVGERAFRVNRQRCKATRVYVTVTEVTNGTCCRIPGMGIENPVADTARRRNGQKGRVTRVWPAQSSLCSGYVRSDEDLVMALLDLSNGQALETRDAYVRRMRRYEVAKRVLPRSLWEKHWMTEAEREEAAAAAAGEVLA